MVWRLTLAFSLAWGAWEAFDDVEKPVVMEMYPNPTDSRFLAFNGRERLKLRLKMLLTEFSSWKGQRKYRATNRSKGKRMEARDIDEGPSNRSKLWEERVVSEVPAEIIIDLSDEKFSEEGEGGFMSKILDRIWGPTRRWGLRHLAEGPSPNVVATRALAERDIKQFGPAAFNHRPRTTRLQSRRPLMKVPRGAPRWSKHLSGIRNPWGTQHVFLRQSTARWQSNQASVSSGIRSVDVSNVSTTMEPTAAQTTANTSSDIISVDVSNVSTTVDPMAAQTTASTSSDIRSVDVSNVSTTMEPTAAQTTATTSSDIISVDVSIVSTTMEPKESSTLATTTSTSTASVGITDVITFELPSSSIVPWLGFHHTPDREWTCDHMSQIEWDSVRVINAMRHYYGMGPLRVGVHLQGLAGTKAWEHDNMFRNNLKPLLNCPPGAKPNSSHGYRAPHFWGEFDLGYRQCCYADKYLGGASPSCSALAFPAYLVTRGLSEKVEVSPAGYEVAISSSRELFNFEKPVVPKGPTGYEKAYEAYIHRRTPSQRDGNYFGYTYGTSYAHKKVIVNWGGWAKRWHNWRFMATAVGRITTYTMFHNNRHRSFQYGDWDSGDTAWWYQDAPCSQGGAPRPDRLFSRDSEVNHRPDWFLDFFLGTHSYYSEVAPADRPLREQWDLERQIMTRCLPDECDEEEEQGLSEVSIMMNGEKGLISGAVRITRENEQKYFDGSHGAENGYPVHNQTGLLMMLEIEGINVEGDFDLGTVDSNRLKTEKQWLWELNEKDTAFLKGLVRNGILDFIIRATLIPDIGSMGLKKMEYYDKFYTEKGFYHGGETESIALSCCGEETLMICGPKVLSGVGIGLHSGVEFIAQAEQRLMQCKEMKTVNRNILHVVNEKV